MFTEVGFGFALYEYSHMQDESKAVYNHKGLAETEADAQRWADGDDSITLVKIHPTRGKAE